LAFSCFKLNTISKKDLLNTIYDEGHQTMAYATLDDLLQVEPTIQDYGVLDWDVELARSETEVNRVLTVRWYQEFRAKNAISSATPLDPTLLDPTQWTQATVYHALAYHIFPKLSKFEVEQDNFQVKMEYYQGRFDHEMDLCLREGVRYDVNEDDTFSPGTETQSKNTLRLVR
jgi:hypothetical protein